MEEIRVAITGHTTPQGRPFEVHAKSHGARPPSGVAPASLAPPIAYYDVFVDGISDGTATVCITSDAVPSPTRMQYWDKGKWVDVMPRIKDHTICGEIPVPALHGTPIVIGTH